MSQKVLANGNASPYTAHFPDTSCQFGLFRSVNPAIEENGKHFKLVQHLCDFLSDFLISILYFLGSSSSSVGCFISYC